LNGIGGESKVASVRIIGHAIVSADGMIADAAGKMPSQLRSEADWRHFQAALDASDLTVIGRRAAERFPNPGRRRLVVTRGVGAMAVRDHSTTLWNPAGIGFAAVLQSLGLAEGRIAVTGLFDLFLGRFTGFDLAEVHGLTLPGGQHCFASGHPRAVLALAGLAPQPFEPLEPNVTLTRWR
jgi:hypothetical protein